MVVAEALSPGTYVVAVSGGIDSVVLLDLLMEEFDSNPDYEFVVAHFDHGIRPDSLQDLKQVADLAKKYGLALETAAGQLGPGASEQTARSARYKFLREVKQRRQADAILTAHHQDDVIETAIINLLRGTYRKGLSSLKSSGDIIRPLIKTPKSQLLEYAKKKGLQWREDETNTDTRYLRNYVRLVLVPAMSSLDSKWRQRFLAHIDRAATLNRDINDALDVLALENVKDSPTAVTMDRHWFIMLPAIIGREVLQYMLERAAVPQLSARQLQRALLFSKTAQKGKQMEVGGGHKILIDDQAVLVTK